MSIIDLSQEPEWVPTLAKWHHNEWLDLNPGGTIEKRIEKMQSYLGEEFIPSTFIFKKGKELVGSVAIVEHDMDTKMDLSPWMASLFVSPKYRKAGIGSSLVNHIVAEARASGLKRLYLFTPTQEKLYRKLGWSTISKESYRNQLVTVMMINLRNEV